MTGRASRAGKFCLVPLVLRLSRRRLSWTTLVMLVLRIVLLPLTRLRARARVLPALRAAGLFLFP